MVAGKKLRGMKIKRKKKKLESLAERDGQGGADEAEVAGIDEKVAPQWVENGDDEGNKRDASHMLLRVKEVLNREREGLGPESGDEGAEVVVGVDGEVGILSQYFENGDAEDPEESGGQADGEGKDEEGALEGETECLAVLASEGLIVNEIYYNNSKNVTFNYIVYYIILNEH